MMELARLRVVIEAVTDSFDRAMNKVEASGQQAAKSADESGKKIAKSVADAGQQAEKSAGTFKSLGTQIQSYFKSFGSIGQGFRGGIDAAKEYASSLSQIELSAGGAAAALGPVGIAIGVVAGAAAAGVAITGMFVSLAKEGSELGGAMYDLSLNTGLSVEALSKYKIAAEQSGSNIEALAEGVSQLSRRLQDAASGDENLSRVFKALGVDAKAAAEDPQGSFEQLATKIAAIEDPLLRTKAAAEVFGDSGTKLISTFVTLQQDGDQLKARMTELGLVMSGDVAKGADAISDEFVILGAVSDSLKVKIANEMAPQIVSGVQTIEGSLVKLEPLVVSVGAAFLREFAPVIGVLALIADGIDNVFGKKPPSTAFQIKTGYGDRTVDYGNAVEVDPNTGRPWNPKDVAPDFRNDPNKALRAALAANKKRSSNGGGASPVTPADTTASFKQAADARLALEESRAKRELEIEKSTISAKIAALKEELSERTISLGAYFEQRRTFEQQAVDAEVAGQQRIIAAERKRIAEAEAEAEKQRARANKIDDEKRSKAKNPAQRKAIEEDRTNRQVIIENELQATRDRHYAKIEESEGKILALQQKRQQQASNTSREETKANEQLERTFEALNVELLRSSGRNVEAAAAELGKTFADTMALAIREGRGDIAAAIQDLTSIELNKARAGESRQRLDTTQSALEERQAQIQNDLNRGIISEVTARHQQMAAQEQFRSKLLEELELEKQLAVARGDAVEAARLGVEIERTKGMGREIDPHLKNLRDNLTRDFDELQRALESGTADVTETLKNFARSFFTDIISEIQTSVVEKMTGEKSIGAVLGKGIANKIGDLFGFGQQPGAQAPVEDPSKLIIQNLSDNAGQLTRDIQDLSGKSSDVMRAVGDRQTMLLQQIAASNAEMANCACAPPAQPSLLGTILNGVIGAVGAGFGARVGGGGGGGGFHIAHGVPSTGAPTILKRADGGLIQGAGSSTSDSIPLMVSDGEYVLRAAAVERIGVKALDRMNRTGEAGWIRLAVTESESSGFVNQLANEARTPRRMAEGGLVGLSSNIYSSSTPVRMEEPNRSNTQTTQASAGKVINISINVPISAPQGSVSPQTRQQIATQTAQALNAALQRNG